MFVVEAPASKHPSYTLLLFSCLCMFLFIFCYIFPFFPINCSVVLYIQVSLSPNSNDSDKWLTKVKHVVPALTEDVPGFRKQLVQPTWHGHGEKCHDKHGVDRLNETLRLFRNDLIEATNSGFKQHWGNACQKKSKWGGEKDMTQAPWIKPHPGLFQDVSCSIKITASIQQCSHFGDGRLNVWELCMWPHSHWNETVFSLGKSGRGKWMNEWFAFPSCKNNNCWGALRPGTNSVFHSDVCTLNCKISLALICLGTRP